MHYLLRQRGSNYTREIACCTVPTTIPITPMIVRSSDERRDEYVMLDGEVDVVTDSLRGAVAFLEVTVVGVNGEVLSHDGPFFV